MKRRKTVSVLILLLVAILMLTGLSSCKDPEPEPLTDEEALRGQWAVYYLEEPGTEEQTSGEPGSADTGTQEKEIFAGNIIDIQYTKPGYWFYGQARSGETDPENIEVFYDVGDNPESAAGKDMDVGFYISSDRTQEEDGWFTVSASPLEDGIKIRYRFTDEERNTMEAEVSDAGDDTYIMRRLNHVIKINMDTMSVGGK